MKIWSITAFGDAELWAEEIERRLIENMEEMSMMTGVPFYGLKHLDQFVDALHKGGYITWEEMAQYYAIWSGTGLVN
ncbi:hypothetical protein [Laceyella putida]|uniref:Uncharacterized protein n=1 Tax=Laceyella putida TaxID=110101 RepID=A0ABW2RQM2_9BACL